MDLAILADDVDLFRGFCSEIWPPLVCLGLKDQDPHGTRRVDRIFG